MTDRNLVLKRLPESLRGSVLCDVPLRTLTTLRVGGPAALLCPILNVDQALRFQAFCHEAEISQAILGGGSNILAADEGFPGLVMKVATETFTAAGDTVTVGAGMGFDELIRRTLEHGLTGLEFASGIPGTVGGALVGNAGCYGRTIGEFLVEALVLRGNGSVERIGPDDFAFTYRRTALLGGNDVLLEATLRLLRGPVEKAVAVREEHVADRRTKHPVDLASAGSWFKNLAPETPGGRRRPAGTLLEAAGAKRMSVGNAAVFPRHANIIVNRGEATCRDVTALAERMRAAVKERFEVVLEQEVRNLGPVEQLAP